MIMAKNKESSVIPVAPDTADGWGDDKLFATVQTFSREYGFCFVLLPANGLLARYVAGFPQLRAMKTDRHCRVVVLHRSEGPRALDAELENRNACIEFAAANWCHIALPDNTPPDGWSEWLRGRVSAWLLPADEDDTESVAIGSCVQLTNEEDAALFLAGDSNIVRSLIDQLDEIKRHYRDLIGSKVDERRAVFTAALQELLKSRDDAERVQLFAIVQASLEHVPTECAVRRPFSAPSPRRLPRVLILGESGAGKTAVTQYLARRTSPEHDALPAQRYRPIKRVAIPDYLGGQEAMLEYDLFGYLSGAYTGAAEAGNPGVLLSNIGGIVFLDEIGDASAAIQAKLLAYLDDYRVSPRGWTKQGLFCPLMIVAATNRPIDQWAAADEHEFLPDGHPRFRHDLYQRFDIVIRLPGLNERKSELPALVDALLQTSYVNPGFPEQGVHRISLLALDSLAELDYARANFRLLNRLLTRACSRAAVRGSSTILAMDIQNA